MASFEWVKDAQCKALQPEDPACDSHHLNPNEPAPYRSKLVGLPKYKLRSS